MKTFRKIILVGAASYSQFLCVNALELVKGELNSSELQFMFIFYVIFFIRRQEVNTLLMAAYNLAKWTVVEEDPDKGQTKVQC